MFFDFFQGFLQGAQQALVPSAFYAYVEASLSRPTRKRMKAHLLDAIKEERTQYRFKLVVQGKTYHVIYAYIRSAVYTLTYEYVGKKKHQFPKLTSYHNGKPSPRELKEYIRDAVAERQKRIDRAFTLSHLKL